MYLNKNELKQFLALANMYLSEHQWKELEITRNKLKEVFLND